MSNPLVDDIKDALGALIQTVIGLVLMALGIGLLVWEKMNPPTHDAHLWAELGLALLGAAIIPSGRATATVDPSATPIKSASLTSPMPIPPG